MQALSTDKKTFQLTENGEHLGELIYQNMFYLKAELKLVDGSHYAIHPVGIFGTSVSVTRDGMEVASLKMNWRGQVVFTFQDGREFILKGKGFLHDKYIIEDAIGDQLVQFDPKFDWRKFQYNYQITFEKRPPETLLLLLGVYAANYIIASMSGAASGM